MPQLPILTCCSQAPPHETLLCLGPELKIAAVARPPVIAAAFDPTHAILLPVL